jgi:arylsulfatase A-like enzyme
MSEKKPNILIIWGDDIGMWNVSWYSRGLMGYRTPNIDRIANEGIAFTDYYGQQSCTAGRAAFITGQNPLRTGMTKVGMPGSTLGLQPEDPTIAELLKPLGYATGQFGKNHLGDRNEYLPTVRGFDEFFGILYHLNAEEEPEDVDYPKDPGFFEKFGPRGVLDCFATDKDDPATDPRFGRVGKQTVKDTGILTKKRMETVDDEITERALGFIDQSNKSGKPFFMWFNSTAMHFRTHCAPKHAGRTGQGFYNDVMAAHDDHVGQLLNKLDELGIADDTIVMYSTDNGPHFNAWPDGGITPFRSEKDTNWEGGWRVPCVMRWPAKFKAGTILNDIVGHQDMLPTLLAAAGDPNVSQKLLNGYKVGDKTYTVHIDGYNVLPYLTGEMKESPRKNFFYVSDDGDILGIRLGDWKIILMEQRAKQLACWEEPFVKLRSPKFAHLRRDPCERAEENSNTYFDWCLSKVPQLYKMQEVVAEQIADFVKYPPRQKPASFNLDTVMHKLAEAHQAAQAGMQAAHATVPSKSKGGTAVAAD